MRQSQARQPDPHESPVIVIKEDPSSLVSEVLLLFEREAKEAIARRGVFRILLSGGSTPLPVYERLYELDIDFRRVQFYWGDERVVPRESPESNYGNFVVAAMKNLALSPDQLHPIPTRLENAEMDARAYESEVKEAFGDSDFPRFDLAFQGMGADGHTASLFPGVEVKSEGRLFVAPYVPRLHSYRISATEELLNGARAVIFLVTGKEKASAVRRVLRNHEDLPAHRLNPPGGQLYWLLDRDAASEL